MDNIENVHKFIQALNASISNLKPALLPFLQKSLDELITTTAKDSDHLHKIRIYNNYLYTLISLLFAYLKTIGVDTNNHPIMSELSRIKTYINRAKQLQTDLSKDQASIDKQNEKAKHFLQNTLGTKSLGAAADSPHLASPAISSSNFKGTHTRFVDRDLESKSTKQYKVSKNRKK